MKKVWNPTRLPAAAAILGTITMILRVLLYGFGVDERNLLVENHPLEWAVMLLSLGALAFLCLEVRKLDGSDAYGENFFPSKAAMAGHFAAAGGIAVTLLGSAPRMPGYLGGGWLLLGWLSPVCLVLAGLDRGRGKKPFFALHLVPCLFLMLHVVNHYQLWSGNPQLQDYVFTLFATLALLLFSFYSAAFDVEVGKRRMQLSMGLATVFLLTAELANTLYPWLYLGGIAWALTDLCALAPVPKPESEEGKE